MKTPTTCSFVALFGPTGIGKSALAHALCEKYPVELVSVDSVSVYQELNIGSAKPSEAEQKRYPYHLLNCVRPHEVFNVAKFHQLAQKAIADIHSRGHMPLLVGGTGLYLASLTHGLSYIPEITADNRQHTVAKAKAEGINALYKELMQAWPQEHAHINRNDRQRILRAYEVFLQTGQALATFWQTTPAVSAQVFCLLPNDRQALRQSIQKRLQQMLDAGFITEVKSLMQRHQLNAETHCLRSVGYRQVVAMLNGTIKPEELSDKIYFASCQYAKRQITWMRKQAKHPAYTLISNEQAKTQVDAFLKKYVNHPGS